MIIGFRSDVDGSCPGTPSGTPTDNWWTAEDTTSYGCLYAELTEKRALKIVKEVLGAPAPNKGFPFTSSSSFGTDSPWDSSNGGKTLKDDGVNDSWGPKTFLSTEEDVTITESIPNGWILKDVVCSDKYTTYTQGTHYTLNKGTGKLVLNNIPESNKADALMVTCTFKNERDSGTIIVKKKAVPDDGTPFTFDPSWNSEPNFNLFHNDSKTFTDLPAGVEYSVSEINIPTHWVLTKVECKQGEQVLADENGEAFELKPGETVTCTFTNKKASIDIEKATNGADADSPTGPFIAVGNPVNWTYEVENTGNVALTNVSVTDDQGVTVTCPQDTLAAGESMTCTANGTATAGQYDNLGTATGTPPAGPPVDDEYRATTSARTPASTSRRPPTAPTPTAPPDPSSRWVTRSTGPMRSRTPATSRSPTCPSPTTRV